MVINMDYKFNGSISRDVLHNYLSRAVTHCCLLDSDEGASMTFEDDLRMLLSEGAKYIGRSAYIWSFRDINEHFALVKERASLCHAKDPEFIFQCCIFECIHKKQCERVKIPEFVFSAFGLPYEDRYFDFDAIGNFPDGRFKNHWGTDTCVPNIMNLEAKMWIYYMACMYIDCGIEAIHFGQVWLIGALDKDWQIWDSVISLIRNYAKNHARRSYVICDAHCHGLITKDGRSLLDFNSFPIRLRENDYKPQECYCEEGYSDSIFGRSRGGIHPSGWFADPLPFLIELDNWGCSKSPGVALHDNWHAWGYDEITWYSLQPSEYRARFLEYWNNFVTSNYPEGHTQMPSRRCLAGVRDIMKIDIKYKDSVNRLAAYPSERIKIESDDDNYILISRLHYSANNASEACPYGKSDENIVKRILNKY